MEVTKEMRQAVREDECNRNGHSFDVLTRFDSPNPQRIICSNCGKTWEVVKP